MDDISEKCLDLFSDWLENLDRDVETIIEALQVNVLDDEIRQCLVASVNYLFKSLDLIPDGIDDIGYLDDAFILRLSAREALERDTGQLPETSREKLGRLAEDIEIIAEFLGTGIYTRLHRYALALTKGAARGRTVLEIIEDGNVFATFVSEAQAFAESYTAPGFTKDEKNLIKLKAFFDAKLPKAD